MRGLANDLEEDIVGQEGLVAARSPGEWSLIYEVAAGVEAALVVAEVASDLHLSCTESRPNRRALMSSDESGGNQSRSCMAALAGVARVF